MGVEILLLSWRNAVPRSSGMTRLQENHTRQMSGIPRLTFGSTVGLPCAGNVPSTRELPKRCASMFHYQDTNPSPI